MLNDVPIYIASGRRWQSRWDGSANTYRLRSDRPNFHRGSAWRANTLLRIERADRGPSGRAPSVNPETHRAFPYPAWRSLPADWLSGTRARRETGAATG